jgi:sugar lactone lactonase YvrE
VGRWEALAGPDIAAGDIPADLCGDLVMEGHGVISIDLDTVHGDKHSVIIDTDTNTVLKEPPAADPVNHELVIRQARRRQRRRWLAAAVVVVVAIGLTAAVVGLIGRRPNSRRPHPSPRPGPARVHQVAPTESITTGVVPQRPGSLAIGPNGNLYMADDMRNQILERLPNGDFVPVVGTGTVGFAGDGGPATNAELNYPSGITFGPDGTLYIADQNNGRIRAVSPAGVITTIAGDGTDLGWVPDGTSALSAPLEPFATAFGPGGSLYVATSQQVLRLNSDGTFSDVLGENDNEYQGVYGVGGLAVDASADGPDGLAFDSSGNLYVFGFNSKAILMVDPHGIVHNLGSLYPRGPSGLATLPDGSVVAMDELGVDQLSPEGLQTLVSFPTTAKVSYLGVTGFSPNGIAVDSDGTIYLDTYYGNGYADKSALISIAADGSGSASLLWSGRPSS